MNLKELEALSKILGLIIGVGGIIIKFWDTLTGIYFVVVGLFLYLVCGD